MGDTPIATTSVRNADNAKPKRQTSILTYGLPGSGKSTMLGGLPHAVILDTGAGCPEAVAEGSNLLRLSGYEGLRSVYNSLISRTTESEIRTIAIDSLTVLYYSTLDWTADGSGGRVDWEEARQTIQEACEDSGGSGREPCGYLFVRRSTRRTEIYSAFAEKARPIHYFAL